MQGIGKKHHGGYAAGSAFGDIAKRSLEYLGTTPDDPYGYPAGDPRRDYERADWLTMRDQLQEMYKKWNN